MNIQSLVLSNFICLGNRQSFASRQRERLSATFESKKCAMKRRKNVIAQEKADIRKGKNHRGNIEIIIDGIDKVKLS